MIRGGWVVGEWRNFDEPPETASVTKSLTALAVAKLLDLSESGSIPTKISEDEFTYQYLPDRWGQDDPGRKEVRLRHLLTMSSGLEPFDGPYRRGYVDVVSNRPVESPPGTSWAYSSSEVDLLSLVVKRVVGRKLSSFFMDEIGAAIGVPPFRWPEFSQHSTVSGGPWGGAHTPIRGLARIAYLTLRGGAWSGEQYYGYLWSTNRRHGSLGPEVLEDACFMSGWGMQGCFIVPSLDLIVIRLGGDHRRNKHREFYRELMTRVVQSLVDGPEQIIASAGDD